MSVTTICQNHPRKPMFWSVMETYVIGRDAAVRSAPNITSITSMPIYMWWFDHVHNILSRFPAPCNVRHHDLSKSPPKTHVLVGNGNICDRDAAVRSAPNITSITSMPIYMWWFDHVHNILLRFPAPCNVRHHDLSKSPPQKPMFWSVMETYVIGMQRYVRLPISHQ